MLETFLHLNGGFLFSFVITLFITRIWLYITYKLFSEVTFVNASPTIKGLKLHHYMYGIIIIILGLILKNLSLIGVGLALFIDELPLVIKYGNNFHCKEYWYGWSVLGVGVLSVVICIVVLFCIN